MQIVKIELVKKIVILTLLLVYGGDSLLFCAQKVDVFIAIPLSSPHLKTFRNSIIRLQKKIKKAALEQKIEFEVVDPEKLHITLDSIPHVERLLIKQYEQCVQSMVADTEQFDLTDQMRQAPLELVGKERNWAALVLASAVQNDPLLLLFHRLRACFKASGIRQGNYTDFKAHISLGSFRKNSQRALPVDLSWVPAFDMVLPDASLIIKQIIVTTREKVEEQGRVQRKISPEQCFPLQGRAAKQNASFATA